LVLNILRVTAYFFTSKTMLYPQSRDMRHIMKNVVSAPSGISSPQQAVNSIPKPPFRWRYIYVTAYHFCWWWILRCRYTFWCGL